jgi:hypothetical protein
VIISGNFQVATNGGRKYQKDVIFSGDDISSDILLLPLMMIISGNKRSPQMKGYQWQPHVVTANDITKFFKKD